MGQHSKVVVADSAACISSYNFLAADAFGMNRNGREIGVAILGEEPADWLKSAVLG